jgi:voltage-gated potassium channel
MRDLAHERAVCAGVIRMGTTGEAPAAVMGRKVRRYEALTARERRRLVVEATLRTLATVAVVVTLYYVLPFDQDVDALMVAEIALGCAVLGVVIVWQVRTISQSPHPGIRAVEALAFTVPVYVMLFATTFFVMERTAASSFTESLTRTDALYFSVTTLATVGYGDIAAKSESARLVVTAQMMLDLVLLGLVVRLFLNAVKRSHQRQTAPQPGG